MKFKEIIEIFKLENISIDKVDPNYIEEKHGNGENYYKIECILGTWKFIFAEKEMQNTYKVEKEFSTEEDALRYFCFYELSKQYSICYIDKIIEDINTIGTEAFQKKDLLELLDKLLINNNLYSFDNVKKNAVNLIETSKNMFIVTFINESGDKIFTTMELDESIALYAMFRYSYLFSILNQHVIKMNTKGLMLDGVNDNDYKIFFS